MLQFFVIRNFRGTCSSVEMQKGYMLLCRNAKGVHGQRKVGNPWSIIMKGTNFHPPVKTLFPNSCLKLHSILYKSQNREVNESIVQILR